MIKFDNDPRYRHDFHIYPEMTDIADKIMELGIGAKFNISLIGAGYYSSELGCYGYFESRGISGQIGFRDDLELTLEEEQEPVLRDTWTNDMEILEIEIKDVSTNWFNTHRQELHALYVTPPGNSERLLHKLYSFDNTSTEEVSVWYGVYKKPCFNQIFLSMKKAGLIRTEMELARYKMSYDIYGIIPSNPYNKDFVEIRLHDGDHDLVDDFEQFHIKKVRSDTGTLHLSLISCDIERNSEALIAILSSLKQVTVQ